MMNGVDAVAFTDGMIENVPNIRKKSCEDPSFLGIETDGERNEKCTGKECTISKDCAKVKALVIPAKEEMVVAKEAVRLVRKSDGK